MKEQIHVLKIIYDFLDHLSENQLKLLINKKAKLKLVVEKEEVEETEVERNHTEEICEKIESFLTREEAKEYIAGLSLLKAELKTIAKKYNIPLGSKDTNSQIIEKIVENVVGSRLRFDALLNTELKR